IFPSLLFWSSLGYRRVDIEFRLSSRVSARSSLHHNIYAWLACGSATIVSADYVYLKGVYENIRSGYVACLIINPSRSSNGVGVIEPEEHQISIRARKCNIGKPPTAIFCAKTRAWRAVAIHKTITLQVAC